MQRIPATNDASQTFQTVLNDQTVTIKLDYLPNTGCWLMTLTAADGTEYVNGARIQSGVPLLYTLSTAFEGDIIPIPLTKPARTMGRNPWGNTHQLSYLTPDELREIGFDLV